MNWDDLKLLLAIGRAGSVSGAARALGVHRATVLRRFDAMEASLGAHLCDRTPEGYRLTAAGQSLVELAERTEQDVLAAEARIAGEDQRVEGVVRVTMPEPIAVGLVAPEMAAFRAEWPGLALEILATMDLMDLSRRDADIAIRVTADPPETLVGRRFGTVCQSVYATPELARKLHDLNHRPVIGWGETADWPDRFGWRSADFVGGSAELSVQVAMAKSGVGAACIPCFIGDADPDLVRVEKAAFEMRHEVWLLTHPDLRRQARIDAAMKYLARILAGAQERFAGASVKREVLD